MNNDLDKIEEDLKQKARQKKERKISGHSVFRLQEIIKGKSRLAEDGESRLAEKEKDAKSQEEHKEQ
ncbi:MAG: hypothetical protein M1429_01755 [Patescibacteria group bacterium]|nr:hypothetical protein [Patescibacteria group bacterium]